MKDRRLRRPLGLEPQIASVTRAPVPERVRRHAAGPSVAGVICAIQDAATDQEKLRGALDAVGALCGGRFPVLFTHDCRTQKGQVRIGSPFYDAVSLRYSGYYAERNILLQRGSHLLRPGVVRTSQMMCDEKLYLKSEYYNDFVKPMDLEQALGATLVRDGSHTYNLSMYRSYREASFHRRELRLLAAVVPHLARTVTLFERLATARGRVDTFREVLHLLADGVVVVDQDGCVIEANRAAVEILRVGNGLLSTPHGISAARADESRALRATIAAATHPGGALSIERGDTLVVSRSGGLAPLTLVVTPLRQKFKVSVADRPLACLFISEPRRAAVSTDWLRVAYRLTAAEVRVVALLVLGFSTAQLAARTKVSSETVRTHIKRIFAKTGVRHRIELVSLVRAGHVSVGR